MHGAPNARALTLHATLSSHVFPGDGHHVLEQFGIVNGRVLRVFVSTIVFGVLFEKLWAVLLMLERRSVGSKRWRINQNVSEMILMNRPIKRGYHKLTSDFTWHGGIVFLHSMH